MFPCCQFPLLINSALPPTSLPSAAATSWFGSLSARAVSDRGPAHRMEGSRTNICLSTSQAHQAQLTLAGLLLAVGEQKTLIKTGNDPDYSVFIAFHVTTSKTAQGAEDHMDLPRSVSEATPLLEACTARFVRNHKMQSSLASCVTFRPYILFKVSCEVRIFASVHVTFTFDAL